MKSTFKFIIFAFSSVCSIAPDCSCEEITIAGDIWCPINCDPKDKEKPGFVVELAKQAFEPAGYKVTYQVLPWTRTLADVKEGRINGAIGAYHEDAPDSIFPNEEQCEIGMYFYVPNTSSWTYTGVSSLDSIRLGVIQDYSYETEIDKYITANRDKNIKGKESASKIFRKVQALPANGALVSNIKKLLNGQLEALIESDLVLNYNTSSQNEFKDKLKKAGIAAVPSKAFIALSSAPEKKNLSIALSKLLDATMQRLRKNGQLAEIMKKYNLQDWKK